MYTSFSLWLISFIFSCGHTTTRYDINIVIFFMTLHPHHMDVLRRLLHIFLLHLGNQHWAIFYHMIKLYAILRRWMHWNLRVARKMFSFTTVIKNNLSATSASPSSSSYSTALESSTRYTRTLILRQIFHPHSIGRGPFHH